MKTTEEQIIKEFREIAEYLGCNKGELVSAGTRLVNKALKKQRLEIVERLRGIKLPILKIKPSHGNCCTCQECGYDHDGCQCDVNHKKELVNKELDVLIKELEEGSVYVSNKVSPQVEGWKRNLTLKACLFMLLVLYK